MKLNIADNKVLVAAVTVWFVGVMVVALPFATTLVSSAEHATVLPGQAATSLESGVECVKTGNTKTLCHFTAKNAEK
jgi:hypothetical protein